MKAITRSDTPVAIEGDGVELRTQPVGGGMSTAFVTLPAGADLRPAVVGLPDDLCPCPHWGYMVSGRVRMHMPDGQHMDFGAGEAFYWGPGHAPEALEDTEYVDFSPTDEFNHLLDHLRGSAPLAS
jgi:hypothetical protein